MCPDRCCAREECNKILIKVLRYALFSARNKLLIIMKLNFTNNLMYTATCSDRCALEGCNQILFHVLWYGILHIKKHNVQLHPHIHKHFYMHITCCMGEHEQWADQFLQQAFRPFLQTNGCVALPWGNETYKVPKYLTTTFTRTVCPCSVHCTVIKWLQAAVDSHCHGYNVSHKEKKY